MPIKFNCHKCGANLRVPEKHIGKKARCPKCDEKCVVPEASQRSNSGAGLGAEFEDIGDFLDSPPAASPAGIPAATPVAASPVMATPIAPPPPMASSVAPPAGIQSPYSSPMTPKPVSRGGAGRGGFSGSLLHPLYEARGMMKLFGWTTFIVGILCCMTIFGAIGGWLYIWIGWLIKGAAEDVTIGIESGDKAHLQMATEKLRTFFKILGVLTIIWLAVMCLYLLLIIAVFVLGIAGAAAGV